ncbi:MAG: serine/threonine protein kinase [Deltaproteobacteria bacterium]|nr:serine/threonine protein kinase [Deltaproteobacteria bacterium]
MSACPEPSELVAFAEGRSSVESRAGIEAHVVTCDSCSAIVGDARHRAEIIAGSPTLSSTPLSAEDGEVTDKRKPQGAGTTVGRYRVLGTLGAGGMGVVYLAHDPQLDRRVALKLVKPERISGAGGEQFRARILREAQAMARLSDPSVIHVYDVGTIGEQVFIAMELVEGGRTLADWAHEQTRTWQEIVALYLRAGRGLAAAHAAGIVHRDFKPHNVLVSAKDEVRVTDFGLARIEGKRELPSSEDGPETAEPLTREGSVLGTPGYMAPEQMERKVADARSDLFSFCVALFEALHGARPFSGDTLTKLREAVHERKLAPMKPTVPEHINAAVLAGLAEKPEDRPASMEALLKLLERDPAQRRRRVLTIAGASLLVVSLVAGVLYESGSAARACQGAEQKLAGVWDAARKAQVQQGFLAQPTPFSAKTWEAVQTALDRFAQQWTAMRTDACLATSVRKEQSPALLDVRMACLDHRLDELSEAVNLLQSPSPDLITHASQLVEQLTPVSSCANVSALLAPDPPPEAQRAQVAALEAKIARANARDLLAAKDALPLAQEAAKEADALGYKPDISEAQLLVGTAASTMGDMKLARTSHEAAATAGVASKRDDIAASAWLALINDGLVTSDDALLAQAVPQAQAAVERLGPKEVHLHHTLELSLAYVARRDSKMKAAIEHAQKAVALQAQDEGFLDARSELSHDLEMVGRMEEALTVAQAGLADTRKHLGDAHPQVALGERAVAGILRTLGKEAEAEVLFLHALSILEASSGPDAPRVAELLVALAENEQGPQPAKAFEHLARARKILESRPATIELVHLLFTQALVEQSLGRLDDAKATLLHAMELSRKLHGEHFMPMAEMQAVLGSILSDGGHFAEAREQLAQAYKLVVEEFGPEAPNVSETIHLIAVNELRAGQVKVALKWLTQQDEVLVNSEGPQGVRTVECESLLAEAELLSGAPQKALKRIEPMFVNADHTLEGVDTPQARFVLARALWETHGDHARARKLAMAARDEWKARKDAFDRTPEAEQWLAQHR